MSAAEQLAERYRRQAILSAAFLAPGYSAPLRQLRSQIETCGYIVGIDRLRTDCAWLAEQGLGELNGDTFRLTDRGADVVMGRVVAPGVHRPEPGEQ